MARDTRRRGGRYGCPCCGYPTLQERGAYEICFLCTWEDDGQDDPQADEVSGGQNGQYLVMYSPDSPDPRVGGGDGPAERQAKRAIVDAFDSMVGETDAEVLEALWRQVSESEKKLIRELLRRVCRYETQRAGGGTGES